MKETVLVSIIVPVYNVENYLGRCIKSILSQSYKNYELILVDDGSTDISGDMCDWYAVMDYRVVVIHQENGGLSAARNAGTLRAKGDFVTYIDADDYISEDYLEHMVTLAGAHNADIVCGNYLETPDLTEDAFDKINRNDDTVCVYTGEEACLKLLEEDMSFQLVVACWKLIKTYIAKKHLFPIGRLHEDNATTYMYFLDALKVAVSDRVVYAYYIRPDSIQRRKKEHKQRDDELYSVYSRALFLEEIGKYSLAKPAWNIVFGRLRDIVLENCADKESWKEYYQGLMQSKTKQFLVKMKAFLLMNCTFIFVFYRKIFFNK